MKQETLGDKSSGKKVSDNKKEKEKVKEFKNKVAKTISISGFLSITKRLVEQIDRIVIAIQTEAKLDRELRQQEIVAIKELLEEIRTQQIQQI